MNRMHERRPGGAPGFLELLFAHECSAETEGWIFDEASLFLDRAHYFYHALCMSEMELAAVAITLSKAEALPRRVHSRSGGI